MRILFLVALLLTGVHTFSEDVAAEKHTAPYLHDYFERIQAQDVAVCEQNAPFWERWQEEREAHRYANPDTCNYTQLAASPDGTKLARTVGSDQIVIYGADDLRQEQLLSTDNLNWAGEGVPYWTPDSSRIVIGRYLTAPPDHPDPRSGIQVWDVQQGGHLYTIPAEPTALALSPNGDLAVFLYVSSELWLADIDQQPATSHLGL